MALTVTVESAQSLTDEVTAVALPAVAAEGDGGPTLLGGAASVGGRDLPGDLDAAWCARQGFKAKPGQVATLEAAPGEPKVLVVGLGGRAGIGAERWRRAAAGFVRSAGRGGVGTLVLPDGLDDAAAVGAALTEGAVLASYQFGVYQASSPPAGIERLVLVGAEGDADALAAGIRHGEVTADAVSFARDLINTAPSDLTPTQLADRVVERLRGLPHTTVEVWDEARIERERLGGLLGVARGLERAPPPHLGRVPAGGRRGRAARRHRGQGHHLRLGGSVAQDRRGHDDDEDRHEWRRRRAGGDLGLCRARRRRPGHGDRPLHREHAG